MDQRDRRKARAGNCRATDPAIAVWFVEQNALRVRVDPDEPARALYARLGATELNRHWMVWEDSREMLRKARELKK